MTDKEKIHELKNLVDVLCDNISDQPAGCDACWLWEDGVCKKDALYEKMDAEVDNEDQMNFDTEKITALLANFIEKHPLVVECGGEYIMQDDEAQVDALQLVCDIFDK